MANYTTLTTEIVNTTENNAQEFLDQIPNIVNRAEERLTDELDDYGLVTYTSVAVSQGNNIVTLPTGTRIVKNFNVDINGAKTSILVKTDEYLRDYWDVSASTGEPKYYAHKDNTTIMIAPTPSSTSNGEVVHVTRPTTLTSASPDNYFTQFCYDALFNACMVESYIFMKNFQIVPLFEQRYQTSIQTVRNRARRFRRDDMTRPASPAGADNTVVDGSN